MTVVSKTKVNWTKIEESIFSIGIGLLLIVFAPLNIIVDILGGIFIVPGAAYLFAQPEVRLRLKIVFNWVSRIQVAKNTGTISSSNLVENIDTGGGPLTLQQTIGQTKAPYLRVVPKLNYFGVSNLQSGSGSHTMYLSVEVTNIGDGIATGIAGQASLRGLVDQYSLPNDGRFTVHDLGLSESKSVDIVSMDTTLFAQQKSFIVTIQYRDRDGKDMQPAVLQAAINDLKIENFSQALRFEKKMVGEGTGA